MARFFKKENASNPIRDRNNNLIGWEIVAKNNGVLKLDEERDKSLIEDLDKFADNRRGGVVRISSEIYEAQKKSPPSPPLQRTSALNKIRIAKPPELFQKSRGKIPSIPVAAPAQAVADKPSPEVPPPNLNQFRLKARRMSEVKAKAE